MIKRRSVLYAVLALGLPMVAEKTSAASLETDPCDPILRSRRPVRIEIEERNVREGSPPIRIRAGSDGKFGGVGRKSDVVLTIADPISGTVVFKEAYKGASKAAIDPSLSETGNLAIVRSEQSIVFYRASDGKNGLEYREVYEIGERHHEFVEVLNNRTRVHWVRWSPDGKKAVFGFSTERVFWDVFSSSEKSRFSVILVDMETASATPLLSAASKTKAGIPIVGEVEMLPDRWNGLLDSRPYGKSNVLWSEDGGFVAFRGYSPNKGEALIFDLRKSLSSQSVKKTTMDTSKKVVLSSDGKLQALDAH